MAGVHGHCSLGVLRALFLEVQIRLEMQSPWGRSWVLIVASLRWPPWVEFGFLDSFCDSCGACWLVSPDESGEPLCDACSSCFLKISVNGVELWLPEPLQGFLTAAVRMSRHPGAR